MLGKRKKSADEEGNIQCRDERARKDESMVLGKRKKSVEEVEEGTTELLPNLPDDVTVQLICTKLPWRTFHVLSSVNRVWLDAIRSGKINDIRIRSRTSETLALVDCSTDMSPDAMSLYSLRERALYVLPTPPRALEVEDFSPLGRKKFSSYRFPYKTHFLMKAQLGIRKYSSHRLPYRSHFAINGKLYFRLEMEMWVLDLAGQKKWQRCTRMPTLRALFGCTVFEGKIYVFGGINERQEPICSSEVYDPKVDSWTQVSPMKLVRAGFETCVVPNEILVHSGVVYNAVGYGGKYLRPNNVSTGSMEAYNPAKDSWRTIRRGEFGNHDLKVPEFFTLEGALLMSKRNIEFIHLAKTSVKDTSSLEYGSNTNTCTCLPLAHIRPEAVLATKDGFLMQCRQKLYQIRELGTGENKIVLEEVESSPLVSFNRYASLPSIQL